MIEIYLLLIFLALFCIAVPVIQARDALEEIRFILEEKKGDHNESSDLDWPLGR